MIETIIAPQQTAGATDTQAFNQVVVPPGEVAEIKIENQLPIAISTPNNDYQVLINAENFPVNSDLLVATILEPSVNAPEQFASAILSIKLFDAFGSEVNAFSKPIEMCFSSKGGKSNKCLSFEDESKAEWICMDPCLESNEQDLLWFVIFSFIFYLICPSLY